MGAWGEYMREGGVQGEKSGRCVCVLVGESAQ